MTQKQKQRGRSKHLAATYTVPAFNIAHSLFYFYTRTHSDAPALSTEDSKTTAVVRPVTPDGGTGGTTAASSAAAVEQQPVLDMKALQGSGTGSLSQSDNIAEKLRIEETKKQLAAAREGMERQAQRLAEEKAAKEAAAAEKAQQRASAMGVGGAGRWVAPHMRTSMQMSASRLPGATQKLDTASEELFPDLQSAEKKLQEKQQQQTQSVTRIPKKTPVGGGATWASKAPKLKLTSTPKLPKSNKKLSKKEDVADVTDADGAAGGKDTAATETSTPAPSETPAPAPAAPAAVTIQPKLTRKTGTKKKKKDLSTFKPGGAS
jgi:hypothetical protein